MKTSKTIYVCTNKFLIFGTQNPVITDNCFSLGFKKFQVHKPWLGLIISSEYIMSFEIQPTVFKNPKFEYCIGQHIASRFNMSEAYIN